MLMLLKVNILLNKEYKKEEKRKMRLWSRGREYVIMFVYMGICIMMF